MAEPVKEGPEHAWAESRDRYPDDLRLRRNGFRIHARPKGVEPTWARKGRMYKQSVALRLCRGE